MENMIKLHASLEVLEHKLKNFHWHIVGFDHFEFHEQLDKLIASCRESVDEVAERLVMQGELAACELKQIQTLSIIKEAPTKRYESDLVAQMLVDDFTDLLKFVTSQDWNMINQPVIDNLIDWVLKANWQFEASLVDLEEN